MKSGIFGGSASFFFRFISCILPIRMKMTVMATMTMTVIVMILRQLRSGIAMPVLSSSASSVGFLLFLPAEAIFPEESEAFFAGSAVDSSSIFGASTVSIVLVPCSVTSRAALAAARFPSSIWTMRASRLRARTSDSPESSFAVASIMKSSHFRTPFSMATD